MFSFPDGIRPISKSSDYHFINSFAQLIASESPAYFQVVMKSAEYDEYLFDSHMELYDVTPLAPFTWAGVVEQAKTLNIPALFLVNSDIGIDKSVSYSVGGGSSSEGRRLSSPLGRGRRRSCHLFFILFIPSSLSSRCSYLKSTNRNYYADNLWDNNLPTSSQARRYKQMQLKLLPFIEEYDVETLQFTDIPMFEKYHKLLRQFNYKWRLQYQQQSSISISAPTHSLLHTSLSASVSQQTNPSQAHSHNTSNNTGEEGEGGAGEEESPRLNGAKGEKTGMSGVGHISSRVMEPVTIEIQGDRCSVGGDDSELSAVNGGGGRRSEMSPPRSKEGGEGGGGGVLTTAGHTSGHSTNNYSSTTGRSSCQQQQQREDLLSANDNALEEHERSSPTDMTNTLSDHEKEPLTPSGAEEDEKRGDGSCCPEEEEEDEEGDDEDEGTEGEEEEGVKLIRGEGRTEEEEEEETDAAEELEDDRQNKAESSDHRASSEEDSQLHSYA
ncbi:filaggrin-2-like isoform X2 [Symsagittifera roscoffensis]|uniref:filaggrin-2-like isoform X2 n=1 Tax=Symsagittifera roscoffensis TaxID=84072 RepID=UPI00307CADCA